MWPGAIHYELGASLPIGANYCVAAPNSTGGMATLSAVGSLTAADNDVVLSAEGLPTGSFTLFLTSRVQDFVAGAGTSQGILCLGGDIGRYAGPGQIQQAGQAGSVSLTLDLKNMPQPMGSVPALAGQTWNFQAWYRDSVSGSATSNFTDGLSVPFM